MRKIDGVIFCDGTIFKVSDNEYLPSTVSLVLGKTETDGKAKFYKAEEIVKTENEKNVQEK